jgi:hypothetical protein
MEAKRLNELRGLLHNLLAVTYQESDWSLGAVKNEAMHLLAEAEELVDLLHHAANEG